MVSQRQNTYHLSVLHPNIKVHASQHISKRKDGHLLIIRGKKENKNMITRGLYLLLKFKINSNY